MRGQEQLIALRKAGKAPRTVQIFAGLDHSQAWRDWHEVCARHAEVEINDDDFLSGLDLRFVVGLRVILVGSSERRVRSIHNACAAIGAKSVTSAVVNNGKATHIFDTNEVTA
jgi:hypothetical protein